MVAEVGDTVHPWYKGIHEWRINKVVKLEKPIEYRDDEQGEVKFDPKILLLESPSTSPVLWFVYWMSTTKTKGKMKWGGGPPMIEEEVLLKLMKDAIKKDMFSSKFLKDLQRQILAKLT